MITNVQQAPSFETYFRTKEIPLSLSPVSQEQKNSNAVLIGAAVVLVIGGTLLILCLMSKNRNLRRRLNSEATSEDLI